MEITDLIQHDVDLSTRTTFGIAARARMYAEYSDVRQLEKLSRTPQFTDNEVLHIGEGSNLLFAGDFNGLVLHSAIKGITRYDKDPDTVYVIAGAGEKMDSLIEWTIGEGLSGLENLSGIPGEAGAAAVQNVGAYGVEASDTLFAVECFDTETRRIVRFTNSECEFGYRDSMFKHSGKGRYIVLRTGFRLDPTGVARNLGYGPLKSLADKLGHTPSPAEVRQEVIGIRNSKLPDPAVTGSAGSFFKNPVISSYYFREEVQPIDPSMPFYEIDEHRVKVPAGWLIEHSGLKGYRIGGAEVYPQQCLVITNADNASADDVVRLSRKIRETVRRKFAIELKEEVNIIDTRIDVTVLGSGTSKGVPEVGCRCNTCLSGNPHDKRTRSSVLVKAGGMNILIDASPDFRAQALRHDIDSIDAVLLTHSHYDHVGGLDDLRPMCCFSNMPVYLQKDVNDDLHRRLDYCFRQNPYPGVPSFEMHEIENRPFHINGLKIVPIKVMHGKLPILGYRIGKFGYITDASHIDENEIEKLIGVDTLIVNALRERKHFAHFCVDDALKLIERVHPRLAYLSHICHKLSEEYLESGRLPENVHPAYDGLNLIIE